MRERGYTMLEIVIVSFLVMLLALTTAAAFRYFNPALYALRDRTRAVTELRMAVAYLLEDFAGAEEAQIVDGGKVRILRRPDVSKLLGGGSNDQGVEYYREEGRLIRHDRKPEVETTVALDITEFAVYSPDGDETRILLKAGSGLGERTITLVWSPTG